VELHEGEAVELIDQVCAFMKRPAPKDIVFRLGPHAHVTYGRGGRVVLPRTAFIDKYRLVEDKSEVRLLVLHETAHYLMGDGPGHSPEFFALLFELCAYFGVDLAFALEDETDYKPRNAPKGYALFVERMNAS
jgi:hypothetical protein